MKRLKNIRRNKYEKDYDDFDDGCNNDGWTFC